MNIQMLELKILKSRGDLYEKAFKETNRYVFVGRIDFSCW